MVRPTNPSVCIIGAGYSGLCMGIQLKEKLGIKDYTTFETNPDVGGTWLVNKYPGCACDIPSHLYSLSFEQNPNWSENYSSQPEILEYLRGVAKKYNLYKNIKFNTQVKRAEWQEATNQWDVTVFNTKDNTETIHKFDILISACGAFRQPNFPKEFDDFKGIKMHSALWDDDIELENKVVGIVGSGSSSTQIIPVIAPKVKELHVFQRNPPWVVPRTQFKHSPFLKKMFKYIPFFQYLYRSLIFLIFELFYNMFVDGTFFRRMANKHLNHIRENGLKDADPYLKENMTPKYQFGCKRIVLSSDLYKAMMRPQTTLHCEKIKTVKPNSLLTADGKDTKLDVLILATGYRVQDYLFPMEIIGKGKTSVLKNWVQTHPKSFYGVQSALLPNAFLLLGPNTGLGHNSAIFMIECQVNYTITVFKELIRRGSKVVTVKESSQEEFMDMIEEDVKPTVWGNRADCNAWYFNKDGFPTAVWPKTCINYWKKLKFMDLSHMNFD